MDMQDKFQNLCWWAEQMIEATRRSYYDWIIARENLEKQETWLYHKGRMQETMAALEMIWHHPRVNDEIKRGLWNKIYALNQITTQRRVLI